MSRRYKIKLSSLLITLAMVLIGTAMNVGLESLVKPLKLPVYMDTLGTVFISMLGGTLPGVLVALVSTVTRGALHSWMHLYFGVISVFLAVLTGWLRNKDAFKSVWKTALFIVFCAVMSGVMSTVLTWYVYRFTTGEGVTAIYAGRMTEAGIEDPLQALAAACLMIDFIDKTVVIVGAAGLYYLLPKRFREKLAGTVIPQGNIRAVRVSLMRKSIAVVLIAEILLGILACSITFYLYQEASTAKYTEICRGVSQSAALEIDANRVEDFYKLGYDAAGYEITEKRLYKILQGFPAIQYIYCYHIEKRGCRVVFDLDSGGLEGADPGDLIPFDDSFQPLLDALFAGEDIDPIITDDTYGWLLTVYTPVRNSYGECVCYVAADIDMGDIVTDQAVFISKMFSLYFAASIIIMTVLLELIKMNVIFPINSMSGAADQFATDTDSEPCRERALERLASLDISSEDEIGSLYSALQKMAEDSDRSIREIMKQNELISTMQDEIILDFAEMVEARDKCTGDHIKKTSYYVRVIAEELRREGKFEDTLNDEYVSKLVRSAPLHDVGKIKISDLILNKPGRLTDEEFELMKTHTTAGYEILTKTSGVALSTGYLKEAIEMAHYHHERWDGTGYPTGLKGGDIPLSARIMAVADVFDALVSQRSYKKPYSYQKAVAIITEESGTHFDPAVVEAFLNIARESYEAEVGPITEE